MTYELGSDPAERLDPAIIPLPIAMSGGLDLDPAFVALPTEVPGKVDLDPVDIALPDTILGELDINPADVMLPIAIPGELDIEVADVSLSSTMSGELEIITADAVLPITMLYDLDINIETPVAVLGERNIDPGDDLLLHDITYELNCDLADVPLPSMVSGKVDLDMADIALPDEGAGELDVSLLDANQAEIYIEPTYASSNLMRHGLDVVLVVDSIEADSPGGPLAAPAPMGIEITSISTDDSSVSTFVAGNSMECAALNPSISVLDAHSATIIKAAESLFDVNFSLFDDDLLRICLPSDLPLCDEFDESVLTAVEHGLVPRFNDAHPARRGTTGIAVSNASGSILLDPTSCSSLSDCRDTYAALATIGELNLPAVESARSKPPSVLPIAAHSEVDLGSTYVSPPEAVPGELDIDPSGVPLPDVNPMGVTLLGEVPGDMDTRPANEPLSGHIESGRIASSRQTRHAMDIVHDMDSTLPHLASALPSVSESATAMSTETGVIVIPAVRFSFSASVSDVSFGLMNISSLSLDSVSTQGDDLERTINTTQRTLGSDFARLNERLLDVCAPSDLPLGDWFDDLVLTSVKRDAVPHFDNVYPGRKGKSRRNTAVTYMKSYRGPRHGLGDFMGKQSSLATRNEAAVSRIGSSSSPHPTLAPTSLNPAQRSVWKPPDKDAKSFEGRLSTTVTLPTVRSAIVKLSSTPCKSKYTERSYSREQTPCLSTPSSDVSHSPASAPPCTPTSSRSDPLHWTSEDCDYGTSLVTESMVEGVLDSPARTYVATSREGKLYEECGTSVEMSGR